MDKSQILEALKPHAFDGGNLPEISFFGNAESDISLVFCEALKLVGCEVHRVSNWRRVGEWASDLGFQENFIHSSLSGKIGLRGQVDGTETVKQLNGLRLAVFEGEFGVAENGAVWLSEKNLPQRILPFIADHLVLCLTASEIVVDMHEAYARLNEFDSGFGVFIAGPSKTADIEQALVIGAQGPRKCTVFLIEKNEME